MNYIKSSMVITIRALLGTDNPRTGSNPYIFQRQFDHLIYDEELFSLIYHGRIAIPKQCILNLETNRDASGFIGIQRDSATGQVIINTKGVIMNKKPEYLEKMIKIGWQPILTKEENEKHYKLDIPNLPDIKPHIFVRFDKAPPIELKKIIGVLRKSGDSPF